MNALLQVASIPRRGLPRNVIKATGLARDLRYRRANNCLFYFSAWTKTCYAVRTTLPYLALIQMSGPQARTRWDLPCGKAIPPHQSTRASGPRALDDDKDVLCVLHTPFRFPRRKLRRTYDRGIIYLDQRAASPIFWHQFSRWFRAQ